jgi:hypothetical protein
MSLPFKSDGFGRPPVDDSFSTLWSGKYAPPQGANTLIGPTGPTGQSGIFNSTITGTANQVNVTNTVDGDFILSLPQSIDTSSRPTFAGLQDQFFDGISIGTSAGFTGEVGVYVGHQAGQGCTGRGICCLGFQSGVNCSNYCTMIGAGAGFNSLGQLHTCVGYGAGQYLGASTSNCIYIGACAEPSSTSVSGEIVIGSNPSGVQGKGTNTAFISATSGLYYTNASFAKFVYTGTPSLLAANTPIPFGTSMNGPNTITNLNGSIQMGVQGYYQITIAASISPTTPNVPGLAFILQLNTINNVLTLYTQPNTANLTVSGTTMLNLLSSDVIRLIFNQDLIFTSQSTITMTVLFFGV